MSVAAPRKSLAEKVFKSVGGYNSFRHGSNSQSKRCGNEEGFDYDEDDTMELVQIGAERTKNVLILMSDTGGGHRASAEAIRDAFQIEFGDEYRVSFCFVYVGFNWVLLSFVSFFVVSYLFLHNFWFLIS